jgi:fructoselysine-6-P-deglycase FrlB-like protein
MDSTLNLCATGREIASQPKVWRAWCTPLAGEARLLRAWIGERRPDEIWLSGAGSSAFIGEVVARELDATSRVPVKAVASTDFVSSPRSFLRPGVRPLIVSFGRSGNSSESLGVLELVDRLLPAADRLNITCNGESALAMHRGPGPGESRALVLPEETHDSGFAMTASFTTMMLSALAVLSDLDLDGVAARIATAAANAEKMIGLDLAVLDFASPPERIVFLGSGCLVGAARECALKVMELTAGRVAALWETPLGFRHGPKSFVDDSTRVVLLVASDALTRRYDLDLAAELKRQFGPQAVLTMGEADTEPHVVVGANGSDGWRAPVFVILAQIAGVRWSSDTGLNVDDPFAGHGNLTRVVSGVRLYADRV